MSVWDDLVGQDSVVTTLRAATQDAAHGGGPSMTHAWLFTGPPGSGRSNAALAFAAALQCERGGCGECHSCTTAAAGSHPDITIISTDGLSIGTDVARDHVRKAALRPALGRWQVLVVEDADRLTDQAANALLKSIEEPSKHTVWMLCAPAVEDVLITIRSRCRPVLLRTPPTHAIASLLVQRDGIEPQLAAAVAAASQGHIGRARGLARDEASRERRRRILAIPSGLRGIGSALEAAQRIHEEATQRAAQVADDADARELDDLKQSWGVEDRGRRPAGYAGALSGLDKEQKRRRTRLARDSIDGVLLDLLSLCRDVAAAQLAPTAPLVNADVTDQVQRLAELWTPESTMRHIGAIVETREALAANAAPLLSLEAMMIGFLD
ncbi:DNA polymerase III subunit delta' [Aeromicrobium sp. Root495]|uniref:DNA polymerase III subunit delta' n=1 Tax=Aeromicrobium sp. Root495 TaxID=1736550 RepID=UPI0006F9420E|nr:DNA polymerase III subunit delta' [Aeromicrobium sp. Root495]KQY58131.1 DNA polymerase III subunit delta' [Aeromicrobium sp. Root495]